MKLSGIIHKHTQNNFIEGIKNKLRNKILQNLFVVMTVK